MKMVRDSIDTDKKQTLWTAVKGQKEGLKFTKEAQQQNQEQILAMEYAAKMEMKKKEKEDLVKKKK